MSRKIYQIINSIVDYASIVLYISIPNLNRIDAIISRRLVLLALVLKKLKKSV